MRQLIDAHKPVVASLTKGKAAYRQTLVAAVNAERHHFDWRLSQAENKKAIIAGSTVEKVVFVDEYNESLDDLLK